MDDLKLLGRNENDLQNEIKIVQTNSKDTYKYDQSFSDQQMHNLLTI
jgi:hypothetical protein